MPTFQQTLHQVAEFIRGMRWVARVTAIYMLIMGFTIIFADEARFSAAGYDYFRSVPGSPDSWGGVAILCGLIMWVGISAHRDRWTGVGALLSGLWSGALAASFLFSAWENPQGNLTGIIVYGKDAVAYMIYSIVLFHYGKYRKEDLDEPPFSDHQT